MCGRYYVDDDTAREIEMLVGEAERKQQTQKNGDIRPSEQALVVNGKKDHLSSELMCWGFPGYQGKGLLINARSESILEKRAFRESVLHRRCIIPARGFYEWNSQKEKYQFERQDSPILYMAGCFNQFGDRNRFVVITTQANDSVPMVHDRMPVILERQ